MPIGNIALQVTVVSRWGQERARNTVAGLLENSDGFCGIFFVNEFDTVFACIFRDILLVAAFFFFVLVSIYVLE